MKPLRAAIAQLNFTVGDVAGNAALLDKAAARAQKRNADVLIAPELALLGYPPKDIVLNTEIIKRQEKAIKALGRAHPKIMTIIGMASPNKSHGKPLHNAAVCLWQGKQHALHKKILLPYYDVFDEGRYFEPGDKMTHFPFKNYRIALSICEDIWNDKNYWEQRNYKIDPLPELKKIKPDLLVNISASPYWVHKNEQREAMIKTLARTHQTNVIYANLVGGNDELIFDGASLAVNKKGRITAQAKSFQEHLLFVDLTAQGLEPVDATEKPQRQTAEAPIYKALVLGLADYVRKCGFQKIVLGLSGGIDSSLTACLATDALGPKNVFGIAMPSRYSSDHSREDARQIARRLNIAFQEISIEPIFAAYLKLFETIFPNQPPNIAEENIQARIRGAILMAISNKEGPMVLATGNKSEIAMGYCTLYGDLMGGLAPISDLPKTWVYRLSRYRNSQSFVIPERVLTKPPSAELKPNQTDQDTLPPYELLDQILEAYIVAGQSYKQLRRRFNPELAAAILRKIDANEFKRRQAPPGLKVSQKAFGFGRRMPIAYKLEHGQSSQ